MPERVGEPGPRFDVTSIGESMVRLSVGVGGRLYSAHSFDVNVAGAETNVCAGLAGLGRKTGWVSRLPDNPLGQMVLARVRGWGVDTSATTLAPGGRVGTYFVELSAPPLPARVTYDRVGSAFTQLRPAEVDWEYLLDTRLLHLTGITPALGANMRELVDEAVSRGREKGVLISLDVNYRSSLWEKGEAARHLRKLLDKVDLLICGRNDAKELFGIASNDELELLEALGAQTSARHVVVTLGHEGSAAFSNGRLLHQQAVPVTVVDRIGAGDAFAAGVIDGVLSGDLEGGLATGSAMAALALSHHGDVVSGSRDELSSIASSIRNPSTGVVR